MFHIDYISFYDWLFVQCIHHINHIILLCSTLFYHFGKSLYIVNIVIAIYISIYTLEDSIPYIILLFTKPQEIILEGNYTAINFSVTIVVDRLNYQPTSFTFHCGQFNYGEFHIINQLNNSAKLFAIKRHDMIKERFIRHR